MRCPKVYLPFIPHIFVNIHHNIPITDLYSVSYLKIHELEYSDHLLHKSTSSIGCQNMIEHYNLSIDGQEQYCSTTRKKILSYREGLLIQREDLIELLDSIGDVDDIRFVVLTLKNCIVNNINETSEYYTSPPMKNNRSNVMFCLNI